MNVVCIIPARGGSKGIPGKNVKLIAGKPLICWSIEHAKQSKLINCGVYVSSDCDEILRISQSAGVKPIKRPSELSSDKATSESALQHAIGEIANDVDIDYVVFLQCTSPVRQLDDIDNAIATVIQEKADSLLSVLRIKDYFVWQDNSSDDGGASSFNFDYQNRKRRQDLPTQYLENGSIYVFKPQLLMKSNNRLGGKIALYPMEKFCSQQIDDDAEFKLCEAILEGINKSSEVAI